MYTKLAMVVAVGAALSSAALAQTPNTVRVTHNIHETPALSGSPVQWTIELLLSSEAVDGDDVGWEVMEITITESETGRTWTESSPSMTTADGLWWISHADADNPTTDEFVIPPYIVGTAYAGATGYDDLDYDIRGEAYTPPSPPNQAPYAVTSALSFEFTLDGDQDPIRSGEDEPAELPPIDDDPD